MRGRSAAARISETGLAPTAHSSGGAGAMTMTAATATLAIAAAAAAHSRDAAVSPPQSGAAAGAAAAALIGGKSPILSVPGCQLLDATCELDYLTHIVLRMYENKAKPVASPGASPGAGGEDEEPHQSSASGGAPTTHRREGGCIPKAGELHVHGGCGR